MSSICYKILKLTRIGWVCRGLGISIFLNRRTLLNYVIIINNLQLEWQILLKDQRTLSLFCFPFLRLSIVWRRPDEEEVTSLIVLNRLCFLLSILSTEIIVSGFCQIRMNEEPSTYVGRRDVRKRSFKIYSSLFRRRGWLHLPEHCSRRCPFGLTCPCSDGRDWLYRSCW